MRIMVQHIQNETCPSCGASITMEKVDKQHTNGFWNEYRQFACGLILHFSPNFMKVFTEGECRNNKEVIERNNIRAELKNNILLIITDSNVDKKFKDALAKSIKYCSIYEV